MAEQALFWPAECICFFTCHGFGLDFGFFQHLELIDTAIRCFHEAVYEVHVAVFVIFAGHLRFNKNFVEKDLVIETAGVTVDFKSQNSFSISVSEILFAGEHCVSEGDVLIATFLSVATEAPGFQQPGAGNTGTYQHCCRDSNNQNLLLACIHAVLT